MTAILTSRAAGLLSDSANLDSLPLNRWPSGGVALTPRAEDEGKLRAVIYARISRDGKGNHLGVRRQIESVWKMLHSDCVVVHIYVDNDISAFSGKHRPDYEAMVRRIETDPPAVIGAWHTDRLHRNMRNLLDYIDVVKPRAVSTRCVSAGVLDLSTANGVMTAQIGAAVATQEVAHSRERILAKKEQQRAGGEWTGGRAPFGYRKHGKSSLALVEKERDLIRAAVGDLFAGQIVGTIAAKWNTDGWRTRGGRRWDADMLRKVLVSPTTAGRVAHDGQDTGVTAVWPAILTEDEWRGVCAVVDAEPVRKLRPRSPKRLLSGVGVCGKCGAPMKATRKTSGAAIYVCSATQHVKRMAAPVDDYVAGKVIEYLARSEAVALLTPDRTAEATELHTRASALRARKAQLGEAFAAGDIDRDGLRAGTERLRAEIADTDDRLAALSAGSALDGLAGRPDVAELWVDLPIERRRAVIEATATVTILPGKRGGNPGTRDLSAEIARTVAVEWKGAAPADRA